jgi:hypothetical protein
MAQTKHILALTFSLSITLSLSSIVFTAAILSFPATLLISFRQFISFLPTLYFNFLSLTSSFSAHFSFPLSNKDRN